MSSNSSNLRLNYNFNLINRIKTRIQSQASNQKNSNSTLSGAARSIYAEGGFTAFFRGIASPLLSLVILNTLNFSTYATFKESLGVQRHETSISISTSIKVALAGGLVGPLSALISTPFEMVKTQMQLNIKTNVTNMSGRSSSSTYHAYKLVKLHGFRVLYSGHGVNTVREVVFLATYFTVYENIRAFCSQQLPPMMSVPFAGGFSGAVGWLVSFPLDCIKSNIQGAVYAQRGDRPLSAIVVMKQLLKVNGVLGLYAGVIPSLVRAFLVSSSRFSAYETTLWILNDFS